MQRLDVAGLRHAILRPAVSGRFAIVLAFSAAALVSTSPLTAHAAYGVWSEFMPPSRSGHSAIYDPVNDRMVVFGGSEGGVYHAEVWALSLSGVADWTEVEASGSGPIARHGHSAIYDPVRKRMLVFGGYGGTLLNDVWAFSLAEAPSWTLINAAGTSPSPRSEHSAIYDPVGDRMLIFGGGGNEVWALSLDGVPAWVQIIPAGAPPSARNGHTAIHDPVRQRMVVFGGPFLNDVWALSLAESPAWTEITPAGPQPLDTMEHIAVYAPLRDRMIVVGGWGGYGSIDPRYECWALPLVEGSQWESLPDHGRAGHSGIYDPLRDAVVVYGGYDSNSTSRLILEPSPSWSGYSGTDGPLRTNHTAIYDPGAARMVVFGGFHFGGCLDPCPSGGTWGYSLGGDPAWTGLAYGPRQIVDHTAVYDPLRQRMLVFGGDEFYGLDPLLNETWALSLTGEQQWSQVMATGSPPAPRREHSAIYDPIGDRMLVFGGTNSTIFSSGTLFNDLWALRLAGPPGWTSISPLGVPPTPRAGHTAVYDPSGLRMLVFGGADASGAKNDLWELSLAGLAQWTQLIPIGTSPSPRTEHTAIYDSQRLRMVVYGGTTARDVWILDLSSPLEVAWSLLDAAGIPPSGRFDHTAIYDPAGDRMIVFGGASSTAVTALNFEQTTAMSGEAPGFAGFSLAGAQPNPNSGDLTISFALPTPGPAALELIDVAGRRLARRELRAPAPGSHLMRFDGLRLAAGTYFIRLTHEGRSLSSKVSIVR